MKFLRILMIMTAMAAFVSPLLRADVYETNNTPCTTKIVMVKQYTFQNGWLVNCPTWEAPVAYGATLSITDYTYGYYVPDQWGNLQYQSYEVRFESQYSYHVSAPCPWFDDTDTSNFGFSTAYTGSNPLYSFFASSYTDSEPPISGPTASTALNAIIARLEQLAGRSLTQFEKDRIFAHGCVDIARMLCRAWNGIKWVYPGGYYPERTPPSAARWKIKAYAQYNQATAASCEGSASRVIIYAAIGSWANGAPTPTSVGEVPVASINATNYIVRMPGNENKWFGISHGTNYSTVPQTGHVYDGPPPDEDFPDVPMIFVRVCIYDE